MDDFDGNFSCDMHETNETDETEAISESILRKLLDEVAKKTEDKKEAQDEKDKQLEGEAKKLAPKLASGELTKEEEVKLRAAVKEAFTAGKTDTFVKYLNAEFKALKSDFEFVVPKQDVFVTLKVQMMNKKTEKEAWALDVLVTEFRIG